MPRLNTTYHSGGLTPAYATAHGSTTLARPDVLEAITVVQSLGTPFLNRMAKAETHSANPTWLVDSFGEPWDGQGTAAADILADKEDQDYDPAAGDSASMIGNYCHITSEGFGTTRRSRSVSQYGVGDEHAYRRYRAAIALARKAEYTMLFSQAATGGYANTSETLMSNAPKMHGLFGWGITTGEDNTTSRTIAGHLVASRYASTFWSGPGGGSFSSDAFINNLLQPMVLNGNELDSLVCVTSFKVKRAMSNFNSIYPGSGSHVKANEQTISAREKSIILATDYFETPLGTLAVSASRMLSAAPTRTQFGNSASISVDPTKSMILFDPSLMDVAVLDGPYTVDLSVDGGKSREQIILDFTLRPMNPKAIGIGLNLVP